MAKTDHMSVVAQELLEFTKGVNTQFHEPDNNGIQLTSIVGTKLDNANGTTIIQAALDDGQQEVVVHLYRVVCVNDIDVVRTYRRFNLADLFALARIGASQLTRYQITE